MRAARYPYGLSGHESPVLFANRLLSFPPISDERSQELLYAGMHISDVFKEDISIGGVVALLWVKRRLPPYATNFVEMVLMLTADHTVRLCLAR